MLIEGEPGGLDEDNGISTSGFLLILSSGAVCESSISALVSMGETYELELLLKLNMILLKRLRERVESDRLIEVLGGVSLVKFGPEAMAESVGLAGADEVRTIPIFKFFILFDSIIAGRAVEIDKNVGTQR